MRGVGAGHPHIPLSFFGHNGYGGGRPPILLKKICHVVVKGFSNTELFIDVHKKTFSVIRYYAISRPTINEKFEYMYMYTLYKHCIPHTCHFFYTGRIFENQILHPKKPLKAPKTLKMSLKKLNICIFSLNLEKFTPDRKFLQRHRLLCL